MMVGVRDAQPVDSRPPGLQHVEPRHVPAWIHHAGAWRRGSVHAWFRDGDRWLAWAQHQPADENDPQNVWGLYVYDRETIRRRYATSPKASVEVPSAWGPSQAIKTSIRGLGYDVDHVKTGDASDILRLR